VSMFYLRGKNGSEAFARIRNLCDTLFVDSGVFSLRAKVYKGFGVSFHTKYWKLSQEEKDLMIAEGHKNLELFDAFAEEYSVFLKKHSVDIDVAIDLDVEQFLDYPKAEEYYELLAQSIPAEKLMRVWHSPREWKGWKEWCDSGKYTWLAMEGGWEHDRDIQMYNRFTNYAHIHNIKVHVLAVTTNTFFRDVCFDTCDSSTYTVGGRWARLLMPNGKDILIGKRYKAHYPNHFDNLTKVEQDRCRELMAYFGFTPEELAESHDKRCLFNILMFLLFYDKPATRTTGEIALF